MFVVESALSISLFGRFSVSYFSHAYITEIEGLKRKLTSKLGANSPALVPDWQVTSFLAIFTSKCELMKTILRNRYL